MRKLKKGIYLPIVILLAVVIAGIAYVSDYYHSDESLEEYLSANVQGMADEGLSGYEQITMEEIPDGLLLSSGETDSALIFYPGAKVEYTAYLPLLCELARQGTDCFLIRMPCNLAFLGRNKAGDILESYDYEHWYLAGHSLGGAMAAAYAAEHPEKLEGLILLAAYPTKSLADSALFVLSVYGSEDGILNMDKVEDGRELMPEVYSEICIEGGNHAQFGNYGIQSGDKEARISRKEQQEQTVRAFRQIVSEEVPEKENNMEDIEITYQQIMPEQAKEFMDSGENVIILDVRTKEEYQEGHIPGAVLLPNETIGTEQPGELPDKEQKILVYCRSGNRSKQAAEKLVKLGYTNVYEFGGIVNWPYETERE